MTNSFFKIPEVRVQLSRVEGNSALVMYKYDSM